MMPEGDKSGVKVHEATQRSVATAQCSDEGADTNDIRLINGLRVDRDSSVGIATRYGPDGPRNEARCGRGIMHLSRNTLVPTQSLIQWVPGHSQGLSGRSVALTTRRI